jgi:hypothetical protein
MRHGVFVERAERFLQQALAGVHLMYHARSRGGSIVHTSCVKVLEGHVRERVEKCPVGLL